MMNFTSGIRDEWKFTYTASAVAEGAKSQHAFRLSRVQWWTDEKAKLMAEVRESGVEVVESVAAQAGYLSNSTTSIGPQVTVRADLQKKLTECHAKIQAHQQAAAEYDGWFQVLSANPQARLELTQGDWLYFFGKV